MFDFFIQDYAPPAVSAGRLLNGYPAILFNFENVY
jgi:hypothetical protein